MKKRAAPASKRTALEEVRREYQAGREEATRKPVARVVLRYTDGSEEEMPLEEVAARYFAGPERPLDDYDRAFIKGLYKHLRGKHGTVRMLATVVGVSETTVHTLVAPLKAQFKTK